MMNALTREIFRLLIDQLRKEPIPPISRQEFEKIDTYTEVKIRFLRGSREHFQSAGYFWLMVILSEISNGTPSDPEWFLQTMLSNKNTRSQEISREEFTKTVQLYDFVENEHNFSLSGQFQQAWLMYDGIETGVLAETDCEFVAFFWELID
jgi:hypothetical protein